MSYIQKLFDNEIPFAVVQYFETFKANKDLACKKYELLYIRDRSVRYKDLEFEDMLFVNENRDRIKSIIKNKDGEVFEFNNFKAFKEQQLIEH